MRLIDLMNDIVEEKELPTRIKFEGRIFEKKNGCTYMSEDYDVVLEECIIFEDLEKEIEVLDDAKIIKWGKGCLEEVRTKKDYTIKDLQKYIETLMKTQNQIINKLDKISEVR